MGHKAAVHHHACARAKAVHAASRADAAYRHCAANLNSSLVICVCRSCPVNGVDAAVFIMPRFVTYAHVPFGCE